MVIRKLVIEKMNNRQSLMIFCTFVGDVVLPITWQFKQTKHKSDREIQTKNKENTKLANANFQAEKKRTIHMKIDFACCLCLFQLIFDNR